MNSIINDKAISKKSSAKSKLTSQRNNESNKIPKIEIIGESRLNTSNPNGLSKHNNVIVSNHPRCTTEDLKSFIVPPIMDLLKSVGEFIGARKYIFDITDEQITIRISFFF